MSNWHLRKGYGQLLIGGFVWVVYLASVWLAVRDGHDHTQVEIMAIPASWILNYVLNRQFNFQVPHTTKRFISFISISGISWVPFLVVSYMVADFFGFPLIVGHALGIIAKTASNVVLQQLITFKDAKHENRAA